MSELKLPIVETSAGHVRGIPFLGVDTYLGVPFGQISAGAGRFQLADPYPKWTGTYDAFSYGPAAPQPDSRLEAQTQIRQQWSDLLHPAVGNGSEGIVTSEECLNLNVWAPKRDGAEKLPVVVWLHGGSFHSGSTAALATQGATLARDGRVVVVSIAHRLGVFGCARLDLLAPELFPDAGVLGQLDIVLGLEWVQKNIGRFGGDENNVTLMGQSGGGMKITTLLGMPAAEGLFHRAINCSGPGVTGQAEDDGARSAELLLQGAGVADSAELAKLPTSAILEAGLAATKLDAQLPPIAGAGSPSGPNRGMMMFSPGIHSQHLPAQPMTPESRALAPWASTIPMMYGYTTHEATLFLSNVPGALEWGETESAEALRRYYPEDADDIRARYSDHYGSERPHLRLARILSDASFRSGQRRLARLRSETSAPTYLFHFGYNPEILDGVLGSTHGMDVPFIFGTVDRSPLVGYAEDRFELSQTMLSAVAAFAHRGEPAVPGGDEWQPATPDAPHTMYFGAETYSYDASAEDAIVVWGEW